MGAPLKNQNARKGKLIRDALVRDITQRDLMDASADVLRKLTGVQINKALEGDLNAAIFVRDTLDGRPVQQTELTGADGKDLFAPTVDKAAALQEKIRG